MVMLRKLMELIRPERRALRVCEACGNPFRCGASLKGTGAALAMHIVGAAARLLCEMATFAEAGVSDREA
jgi:hypothetical protein